MGRPQPVVEFEREMRALWQINVIYILHGVVVWAIASAIHFLLAVRNPLSACMLLQTGWLQFIFSVLGMGILLGLTLSMAILISGMWFPRTPVVHIALPLLCAGFLGAVQGAFWGHPDFVFSTTGVMLRSEATRITVGLLLGLCATPIIIVRSSKACRRRGLIPDRPSSEEDSRWRC